MYTLQLTSRDRATLIRSRFFARLPPSTVEDVLKSASVSEYEERDVLFRQDENVDDVFFVLSGLVRLCRMGKDGREADVALFPEGEMFAETAMFLRQRATASAVAAERSVTIRLNGGRLQQLAATDHEVAQALIEHLCYRGKMTEDLLAEDRLLTATQRVANFILSQCPKDSASFSFRLPFQKHVLAGKLGVAPEALSRAFSTLRQSGVMVRGRLIEIHDRPALERF
ncbi:Crp/Fnr family transcriptional regulator [Sinorhizobium sp. BJ1]|uniref:Crp/Fnr family transcriptional regulator n=1 Tax=Sinorhizobium sp. BJ1 TaxID=2035455 RepID=UPI000BE9746E|nr:Crp/Fnr family transcriptional regulator [Sinorhizobium sp. BJ1]PDT85823.1 Crp/Fnr family transcriptional regulator [Sinorhizobium sp. BJ1]